MDSVSVDNRRAGYLATRHLIDLGHRPHRLHFRRDADGLAAGAQAAIAAP